MSDIFDTLIFTRTTEDVEKGTDIGHYNLSDVKRVRNACNNITSMLMEYGYSTPGLMFFSGQNTASVPTASEMSQYIYTVRSLCSKMEFSKNPPTLPISMEKLNHLSANSIESAIYQLGKIAQNIPATWYYSGQIESGVNYQ